MKRNEFRLTDPLRVRWAEIDAQQVVFNGHYLTYFDTALAAYWRAMVMPYHATVQRLGGDLYLRKASLDYLAPARYDELLSIGMRCTRVGNSSIGFAGGAFRGDALLVSAELVYVWADPAVQQARTVPPALRDALHAFEAGEPMVDVRVGPWSELGAAAQAIRTEVFVEEQHIPADLEWDAADAGCLHAVATNRFGAAVATGRLLEHVPGVAKIGRMAVCRNVRGSGVGRAVLDALAAAAKQQGFREALLHAQRSAESFYAAAGFAARGKPFDEAGIPHIEMVKAL